MSSGALGLQADCPSGVQVCSPITPDLTVAELVTETGENQCLDRDAVLASIETGKGLNSASRGKNKIARSPLY